MIFNDRFNDIISAKQNIILVTFDDSWKQIAEKLQTASIPYKENESSNISGATFKEIILPIATITIPIFIQIVSELRKSSSQTIIRIDNTTINILNDDDPEQKLTKLLEAVKTEKKEESKLEND